MITQVKIDQLNKVSEEIKAFKGLDIARKATNAVPGEGNPEAEIIFIGEAPGFNEDKLGQILTKYRQIVGYGRELSVNQIKIPKLVFVTIKINTV